MTNEPATEGLKRVAGTTSFAATVINNTIGAGIFALPAIVAMLWLRRTKVDTGSQGFKVPGGMVIPLVAIVSICWLFSHLSNKEFISIAVFILILCIIYWGMKLFGIQKKEVAIEPVKEPLA